MNVRITIVFLQRTKNKIMIKKIVLTYVLFLFFVSCTNNNEKNKIQPSITSESIDTKQQLIGEWKEYWGIGVPTDVNYSDIFKIQITTEGEIIIRCLNRNNYLIDRLLFDGKELSFRKENTYNPEDKVFVYYKLKLSDDGNWLEGPITNNKDQSNNVKWKKNNNFR